MIILAGFLYAGWKVFTHHHLSAPPSIMYRDKLIAHHSTDSVSLMVRGIRKYELTCWLEWERRQAWRGSSSSSFRMSCLVSARASTRSVIYAKQNYCQDSERLSTYQSWEHSITINIKHGPALQARDDTILLARFGTLGPAQPSMTSTIQHGWVRRVATRYTAICSPDHIPPTFEMHRIICFIVSKAGV